MLHFRCSTLLKELFHTNLKRPAAVSRNKTWLLSSHNCVAAASFDAKVVSTLKVLHAGAHRPLLSGGSASWGARSYCVKSEGAVTSDEPGKKDDVTGGATGDKCVSFKK